MSQLQIKSQNASQRYTLFPLKWHSLWDFYKKHESSFWTAEEIRLTDDLTDWDTKLTESERYFIKHILAFFAGSDGIVNENLVVNFYNEVEIPEARQFYTMQMMIESIHAETYALLIDTYIRDSKEKDLLFSAIDTIPAIKKKADWAIRWISEGTTIVETLPEDVKRGLESLYKRDVNLTMDEKIALHFFVKERPSIVQRLIAFICVEGIFFSGSFCAIYWLKNRGLLPGLATANEFISRDENMHCEFAIELFRLLKKDYPIEDSIIYSIFKEAVEIEKEFVRDSLPVSLIGMNADLMCEYIEYVADRWLVMMGYNKVYNSKNPFGFMEMISIGEKTNFFETVNSSYQKANVGTDSNERIFSLDEDF